jgi:hypothetical protein
MKPVSPVIPGEPLPEVVYGEDQPEYIPLPAIKTDDGAVTTRWKCSIIDRLRVLFLGNIYHTQLTFNKTLQPICLQTDKPTVTRMFSFSGRVRDWFKWAFNFNKTFGWAKTPGGWLCWDFSPDSDCRIYWSRDATPTPEAGVRVLLR